MCGQERVLTKHHLIPCAVHSKGRFQKRHKKKEMQQRGINVCKLCHDGIHDLIPDEKELAEKYNTLEALLADERIQRHIKWSRKQKIAA
jgi:hypothetical protein